MSRFTFALLSFHVVVLTARTTPAGPAERATLVLIVTNNHSLKLGRPELRYADDDGARYYDLFRMFAPKANVRLLTTLDKDSQALFPHLVGVAERPTKARVLAAIASLRARAAAERKGGKEVDFYFVFAGHGDVERGTGFVELADERFTSADLEQLLKGMPATRSHVIVDSCNSFFLVNARKPGGHRFATPADAARRLSADLPNVGVFLSTSAEADVYEWSELQSGIFSHTVRSGMSGAADANADGHVSYRELSAFVGVAAAKVKNPRYRPQVFARGPGGQLGTPLVNLHSAVATRLEVGGDRARRVAIRDANDLPRVDLHAEAGYRVQLLIGNDWYRGAEVLEYAEGSARATRYPLPAATPEPTPAPALDPSDPAAAAPELEPTPDTYSEPPPRLLLAALAPAPVDATPRGPHELFTMLFARCFGPNELRTFESERAREPEPVFGVTEEEITRLGLVLDQVAGVQRSQRRTEGAMMIGFGLMAGAGALTLAVHDDPDPILVSALAGTGVLFTGVGIGQLPIPRYSERLHATYQRGVASATTPEARQRIYAEAVRGLQREAEKNRKTRHEDRRGAFFVLAVAGGLAVANELDPDASRHRKNVNDVLILGIGGVIGAGTLAESYTPTPTERLVKLWEDDPSRRPRASAAPAVRVGITPSLGGVGLGVVGEF